MHITNRYSTETKTKLSSFFVCNKAFVINDILTKHKIGTENNLKTSLFYYTLLRVNTLASQMWRITRNDKTERTVLYNIITNAKYFLTQQFYFFKWQHYNSNLFINRRRRFLIKSENLYLIKLYLLYSKIMSKRNSKP